MSAREMMRLVVFCIARPRVQCPMPNVSSKAGRRVGLANPHRLQTHALVRRIVEPYPAILCGVSANPTNRNKAYRALDAAPREHDFPPGEPDGDDDGAENSI